MIANPMTSRGDMAMIELCAMPACVTRFVAAGGDGTVHEVVDGIMTAPSRDRRRVHLGILPTESCNELASELGML